MDGLAEMLQGILNSDEGRQQLQSAAELLGLSGERDLPAAPSDAALFPEGFDPKKIFQMAELFRSVSSEDQNTVFLRSLKPLLKPERQPKVDHAIRILQLMALLPVLKESGLLQELFGEKEGF